MILGLILGTDHPWRDEAPALGTVAFDGEVQGLAGASRAPLDLLVLDATDLEPSDLDAIRSYRIARAQTRIIAALPDDAQPGSPVLAGLVGMGVYDLCQGMSLADALDRTPTYADAVRWAMADFDPETGSVKPKIEIREKIVERKVALTSRPVLIAVMGAAPGVGTTTVAVAIAGYLARQGHRVALAEYGPPSLAFLTGRTDGQEWLRGLMVHAAPVEVGVPSQVPSPRDLVRGRTAAYVVADLGAPTLPEAQEHEADLLIVVLPGDTHRAQRWLAMATVAQMSGGVPAVVMGGGQRDAREVADSWRGQGAGEAVVLPPTERGQWPPMSPALDGALAQVLAPVLPETTARRGPRWPARPSRKARPLQATASATAPAVEAPTPAPSVTAHPKPRGPGVGEVAVATARTVDSIVSSVLNLAGRVLEAVITVGLVAAIAWVGLLVWRTLDPASPAVTYIEQYVSMLHWLLHL